MEAKFFINKHIFYFFREGGREVRVRLLDSERIQIKDFFLGGGGSREAGMGGGWGWVGESEQ